MPVAMTTAAPVSDPSTFGAAAPGMFEGGWQPVPIAPATKRPYWKGWPELADRPWTETELRAAIIDNAEAACGLVVGGSTVGIDNDILDPKIAREVAGVADRLLGETPLLRIGQEPKQVTIYRASEPIRGRKTHPVEVYGYRNHIAVFGWHQKAGRPYWWPRSSITELPTTSLDIPSVTPRQIEDYVASIQPLLEPLRARQSTTTGGRGGGLVGVDPFAEMKRLVNRLGYRRAARRLLEGAEGGARHEVVFAVLRHGYREGHDPDAVLRLINRHAPDILDHDPQADAYIERTIATIWDAPRTGSLLLKD